MTSDDVQRVQFKVSHPESGSVWHATVATIEDAKHFLRVSWALVSEAGFVLGPIPDGEWAQEVDYILLVRLACEMCFRRRFTD